MDCRSWLEGKGDNFGYNIVQALIILSLSALSYLSPLLIQSHLHQIIVLTAYLLYGKDIRQH